MGATWLGLWGNPGEFITSGVRCWAGDWVWRKATWGVDTNALPAKLGGATSAYLFLPAMCRSLGCLSASTYAFLFVELRSKTIFLYPMRGKTTGPCIAAIEPPLQGASNLARRTCGIEPAALPL